MTWDYIIIGAGSAGCAVAHQLVRSGRSVLLLEAGGSDRSPFIKFPTGLIWPGAKIANYDWGYRSQPDPSRNGASENWLRGRVLGGSSSINGMLHVRGAHSDFDGWNIPGWSASDVMRIFRECETSDQPGHLRGRSGPLQVRTVKHPHAITTAFLESACAVGYPFNEDYNGPTQEGVSYAQLSQRRGLRCSAADAFLKPLLGKGNLQLLLRARVEKIEMKNGRAVAVAFSHGGKKRREAARDIIVCAGAIDSPKVLMLSGIGDPQELDRHRIDVALDVPGVGCNLKEHPFMRLVYRSTIPTYNLTEGWLQKLNIAAKFAAFGEGPISNTFEAAAFLRSSASKSLPDIQLIFCPAGYSKKAGPPGNGVGFELSPYPAFQVYINRSHPLSNSRIRLASADPCVAPLIESRLLEEQADVDTLIQGIHTVRAIMGTEPIASLVEEEVTPGAAIKHVSALRQFVRRNAEVAYHPVGTCRMGLDVNAVVGPDLRVRGAENLWVADASVIPSHISGNTNAVCIMIGAKLGKQLAARQ